MIRFLRRRLIRFSLFVLFVWILSSCGNAAEIPLEKVFVDRVIDGDTFVAVIDGNQERVRLIGMDTPETKHPRKGVEPFGPEASAFTKDLIEGKEVFLEFDVQERDRYGRVLAYVWLSEGEPEEAMLNAILVRVGLAVVSTYPPNVRHERLFRAMQQEARSRGVGLWGAP